MFGTNITTRLTQLELASKYAFYLAAKTLIQVLEFMLEVLILTKLFPHFSTQ